MPFNPVLSGVALALDLTAIVGYLLTHFGVVSGFLVFDGLLIAGSAMFWIMSIAGLRSAPIAVLATVVLAVILEGALYLNWWGLGLAK